MFRDTFSLRILRLFCCTLIVVAVAAGATTSSSISLLPSSNSVTLSQSLRLTATVTTGATGKVTFYDGTVILGIGTLTAGTATFSTTLLASGAHSLRAYYGGDATFFPSSSALVPVTVVPLLSNGFVGAGTSPLTSEPPGRYIPAVADFNGDGIADMVVPTPNNNGQNDTVSVLLGIGNGAFRPPVSYRAGLSPSAVAVGDFNGDGRPDLAVTNYLDVNVSILLGNGDGSFRPFSSVPSAIHSVCLSVGDFNGDGKADLVVAHDFLLGIYLGNGMAPSNRRSCQRDLRLRFG